MPEEPDLNAEDIEILDNNVRTRVEAKKRRCEEIADLILRALQSRPDGMRWPEIRGMFDKNHSDREIRRVLRTLTTRPTIKIVEQTGEHAGERFLLAAS